MRLLILSNNANGLISFRKKLLKQFLILGMEVYVSVPKNEYSDELESMGCHLIDTPIDRRGLNPIKDLKLLSTYKRLLKELAPNIVLTYTIKPNIYGGLACKKAKIPYITNVTGLGTSIQNPGIIKRIALFLYRLGTKKASCMFFQNKSNMDFMIQNKVGCENKVLIPGSGVDLEEHSYKPYPSETRNISFVAIMRIMKDKGILEFLECAKQIKASHPKTEFTLVGKFDEDAFKESVEQAVEAGIIEYLGFRKDIDYVLSNHNCVINPSYHEGMSNVLLEAAACGRPVIASNVPGCAETFDEGVSGFGFEVKNSDALIACVEKFLSLTYEEQRDMGSAGRAKVEREFDRRKVIDAYISEINKIKTVDNSKEKVYEALR